MSVRKVREDLIPEIIKNWGEALTKQQEDNLKRSMTHLLIPSEDVARLEKMATKN